MNVAVLIFSSFFVLPIIASGDDIISCKSAATAHFNSIDGVSFHYVVNHPVKEVEESVTFTKIGDKYRYEVETVVARQRDEAVKSIVCFDGKSIWYLDGFTSVLKVGAPESWDEWDSYLRRLILHNPAYVSFVLMSKREGFQPLSLRIPGDYGLNGLFKSEQIALTYDSGLIEMTSKKTGYGMGKVSLDETLLLPNSVKDSDRSGHGKELLIKEFFLKSEPETQKIVLPRSVEFKETISNGGKYNFTINLDVDSVGAIKLEKISDEFFKVPTELALEVIDLDLGGYGKTSKPKP